MGPLEVVTHQVSFINTQKGTLGKQASESLFSSVPGTGTAPISVKCRNGEIKMFLGCRECGVQEEKNSSAALQKARNIPSFNEKSRREHKTVPFHAQSIKVAGEQ